MFFPEALYLLSARDQQVTWLDPLLENFQVSSTAIQILQDFTVRDGMLLLLQHAAFTSSATGGETTTQMEINVLPPVAALEHRLAFLNTVAAVQFLSWQGSIALPALWRIRFEAIYSAAVQPKSINAFIAGMLIPIGNVQRV